MMNDQMGDLPISWDELNAQFAASNADIAAANSYMNWKNEGTKVPHGPMKRNIGVKEFIDDAQKGHGGTWSNGQGELYEYDLQFFEEYDVTITDYYANNTPTAEYYMYTMVDIEIKGSRPEIAPAQQGYELQWVTAWTGQNNIISNTDEAKQFYETADGSPRLIDRNSSTMVVNSPEFQRVINRLVTGKANQISSTFDVDMTSKVFRIGDTNVDYETTIMGSVAYTKFTLFVRDGFWDPNIVGEALGVEPDGMGPNLETEGSNPYPYVTLIMKFANPGTYGK